MPRWLLYLPIRRSRYFGNTLPLLIALLFFPLITTGTASEPILWGLPFLLAFIAGVFADMLETPLPAALPRGRRIGAGAEALLCVLSLRSL